MTPPLFVLLAVFIIASALGVILHPSPLRSALSLVLTLFFLAVMFLFLDAHLIAALQVIVYAGAIMVLFLFVIMLLNLQEEPRAMAHAGVRWGGTLVASLFLLAAVRFLVGRPIAPPGQGMNGVVPAGYGSVEKIGESLFTRFVFGFEVTSLLLLVAIVGAVVLAKKRLV